MKSMKIIHTLSQIKYSGAEVMLNLAAPYFKSKGIELHILSFGKELGEYAEILRRSGYKIHHIPFKSSLGHFIKVYKFFKKNKFDAIHMHSEGAFFWYTLVIRLATSVNIIRTVHSVFTYKGYLKLRRILQRFIARKIFKVRFVSIGQSVKTVEKKILLNSTVIVPNWINLSRFDPLKDDWEKIEAREHLDVPKDALIITSVGSITKTKNHKDILTAMPEILAKNKRIFYLNIGDGPMLDELKAYTQQLNIGSHVKFAGQMENVRQALVATDIYIMPSRYEGLGISLIEAMACGLPSVVYNVYGLKDLIVDKVNGFIVEEKPSSLAEAVIKLAENQHLRGEMGENARKMILENYDMKRSLDKLLKLYNVKPSNSKEMVLNS